MAEIKSYFDLDGIEPTKLDALIEKDRKRKQVTTRYMELEDQAGELDASQVDFNGLALDAGTLLDILEHYQLTDEDLVTVHEIAYPIAMAKSGIVNSESYKQALKNK